MGIILIVLFALGVLGWLIAFQPSVGLFLEIYGRGGRAGRDTAMAAGIVGIMMAGANLILFLPAVVCSLLAKHLPMTWRIVGLLPSGTGLLAGAAFLYWAEVCRY